MVNRMVKNSDVKIFVSWQIDMPSMVVFSPCISFRRLFICEKYEFLSYQGCQNCRYLTFSQRQFKANARS